jgi:hypothetical protein
MRIYLVGTALTAAVVFGAAGVSLADPLASGPFELTGPQLDAVTAGSTGAEAAAAAFGTGGLFALTLTDTNTTANASYFGDSTAAAGIATGTAIGIGEGAARATAAEVTTAAEGDVLTFSADGTISGMYIEISYAASASFGRVGFEPIHSP